MSDVAAEVATPVFFSVLIILLVYVPVLTLTGVDGKMFRPMALTVVFALFIALILSLTYIPAVASFALRPKDVPKKDPLLVRLIDRAYTPVLALAVNRPRAVAGLAALMLALGGVLFARSGSELVPQLDEGDLVVQTTRAPDISLDVSARDAGRLEAAVRAKVPEVTQVVSRVGNPAVATDIMGVEQADVFLAVAPREKWRHGLTREELIEQIRKAIEEGSPGGDPAFTQPIQMRFNELLGGSVADVTVSVYGTDLHDLRDVAVQVSKAIDGLPGAADVKIFAPPDVSLVEVRPLALEAAQAGFSVGEILDVVQALRSGLDAGMTFDGPVRIPIVLRLAADATAFNMGSVQLASPSGGLVPLGRVAKIETIGSPGLVNHFQGERRLVVGFNVRGADLGALVEGAQAKVNAAVTIPAGYRVVWGGQYETFRAATRRLTVVVPGVVLLILGTLYAAFRKVRPTLIIFTNVPFACIGGIVALTLRGSPISMSAAVGFIALSGVAVLNGVVLLSRVLMNEAMGQSPSEAAASAARSRARPVLMTAMVAALGFVPMMLSTGVGSEVQRPLATVVVGGLVTSTMLTLLVLPALYPWMSFSRGRSRRRKAIVEA
jgi:cobalt-zinc-cadmium resistance protein CzcA